MNKKKKLGFGYFVKIIVLKNSAGSQSSDGGKHSETRMGLKDSSCDGLKKDFTVPVSVENLLTPGVSGPRSTVTNPPSRGLYHPVSYAGKSHVKSNNISADR